MLVLSVQLEHLNRVQAIPHHAHPVQLARINLLLAHPHVVSVLQAPTRIRQELFRVQLVL